ncbi:MAG: guanylate kinase [Planctomycetes bacterium]|nr:guanylate kinase [Planctomycetota bacterium]
MSEQQGKPERSGPDRGKLVVISGPSGAGKTSVCRALKQHRDVEFSVSATTRPMRPGEQDGVDYTFLTRERFAELIEQGQFLEYAEYNGNLYGTPRGPMDDALRRGKTFLVEIEVDGTRQLRQNGVQGLYLFIEPPSIDELRQRLERRGTNAPEEIAQRVQIAEREIAAARVGLDGAPLYDCFVENVDLDATIERVKGLLWP